MRLSSFNWPITLSTILLLSVGILVIYSSSRELALQQSFFALIGLVLYLLLSQFDYRALKDFVTPAYFLIIILLVVLFILGVETRGSVRWISLGIFNIQPSELAKPILILLLASFWAKAFSTWQNTIKSLLLVLIPLFLVFKQPDLGSALTIGAIWVGILIASGLSWRKLTVMASIVILLLPLAWFTLHEYQKQRVISFLSPHSDPLGVGYNLIQSTIAVGSGQLWGRGLGHGTQSRLQFLPEFRTDFIFASIAEEMGFVGSMMLVVIYFFLIAYSLKVAQRAVDRFGSLIAFGVVSMLLFQVFVNIGMNIGILPITGITLPLISYGGSSLIATLISLGLLASVDKFKKRFDPDAVGLT